MHLEKPMIRRLLIPLLGSGLLLAATAVSALAKCEGDPQPEFCNQVIVDINVGGVGGIFHAGTQESVDVSVSLAERPFDAESVALIFGRVSDGTTVRAEATATDQPGLWRTDVLLPNGGSWTVVAEVVTPDGELTRFPMETMQVASPPNLPPSTTPVTPPVTPTTPALPIALLAAGIAAAVLGGFVLRDRARRRTAGAPAPSGAAASAASADRA